MVKSVEHDRDGKVRKVVVTYRNANELSQRHTTCSLVQQYHWLWYTV